MRRATAAGWLVAFGAAAFLAGCATVVPEPVLIREPPPAPVPLVIGVHYSDDFRSFVYSRARVQGGTSRTFAVGEPSVKLLDQALALLFTRVVQVSRLPPNVSSESAVTGVIEPRIAKVAYELPESVEQFFGGRADTYAIVVAHITYAFTLYSMKGEQLASWPVSGRGVETLPLGWTEMNKVLGQRSLELAMRDAAWKLTSEFRNVPGVRRWLDEHGVK